MAAKTFPLPRPHRAVDATASMTRAKATPDADREASFEKAFEQHYRRVYGVLFGLVGDRAEAEDLAVETFWRLWDAPPRNADNLAGWLYRVAVRLGYNALRAGRRRARYEIEAGVLALEATAPPGPEQAVLRAEERSRVRAALRKLPARDAQLLMLRQAGLSYKELAAALGLAPGSVGALLSRAEAAFERVYGP